MPLVDVCVTVYYLHDFDWIFPIIRFSTESCMLVQNIILIVDMEYGIYNVFYVCITNSIYVTRV